MTFRSFLSLSILAASSAGAAVAKPAPWTLTTLYTFADPNKAQGPLNILNLDGVIYGIASGGGPQGVGALFSYNLSTGAETDLFDFSTDDFNGANPVYLNRLGKELYVSTLEFGDGQNGGSGTIFQYNITSGADAKLFDFDSLDPTCFASAALPLKGSLYGTCQAGGNATSGLIYSVSEKTGAGASLYTFSNGADGGYPYGPTAYANGILYGAVQSVNGDFVGGIFSYNLATGVEKLIHHFAAKAEGSVPQGIALCNGVIYGFNRLGGATGNGTAFAVDPATGAETTLYSFAGGADPATIFDPAPVCEGQAIYGVSSAGGTAGHGTVFEINIKTKVETIVHSFTGADGAYPYGPLLATTGGFYGTTVFATVGGTLGYSGTLFKLTH